MNKLEQAYEAWKEISKLETDSVTAEEEKAASTLYELLIQEGEDLKESFANAIYNELSGNLCHKIWMYSFVLAIFPKAEWAKEQLEMLLKTEELNWKILYFLYGQIACNIFRESKLETKENIYLKWCLLDKIDQMCKPEIAVPLHRIPKQERDENMAVVLVEQFLSDAHGPTKTALDRCHILRTVLGKKVLLINTAELMTTSASIPYFGMLCGSYFPALTEQTMQYWKNEAIPYFQCDNNMPDKEMMEMLLQTIQQLRPGIVVCVGGSSLFAGLVNELVPVLTVGTTSSGLVTTLGDYQIVSKQFIAENEDIVRKVNRSANHMIEGELTYSLKQQTEFVTRTDVGLPEQAFVIGVVGARLDTEITEELLTLLEQIVSEDIVVFIIGNYDCYEKSMEKHPSLKKYVYYKGFCGDILSRIELCDLYLNPLRKGGGTSAVEAMYKGKPVVSIHYGDVSGIVGDDFCCANYAEMEQTIKHYAVDSEYYEIQSQKAKQLSEKYLDSEQEFKRIVEEYLTIMD